MNSICIIYFSASNHVKNIVNIISDQFENTPQIINLTSKTSQLPSMEQYSLCLIIAPVYMGRIPEVFKSKISTGLKNKKTAIAVTYGNISYSSALYELYDIICDQGGEVLSAGAFVTEHTLYKKLGYNRPDKADKLLISDFAEHIEFLAEKKTNAKPISLITKVPKEDIKQFSKAIPHCNSRCVRCMDCVNGCPVGAIQNNPKIINRKKCISCQHCVRVCNYQAREIPFWKKLLIELEFNKYLDRKKSIVLN